MWKSMLEYIHFKVNVLVIGLQLELEKLSRVFPDITNTVPSFYRIANTTHY